MNLISTIMQFLAPAIINKIAGSLGLGQGLAAKAISAAIPAILAGLTGAAAKSGGGGLLSDILGKQDPGLLGNLAGMLGGSGQQGLIDNGSHALSSLLGGSSTSALAGAVGKFAGIGDTQSKSLLGLLAPVVLGTLAKEQKSSGLDAAGLTHFLNGQKSNVAAAMPDGFASLLKGTGLLDSIAGNLKSESVSPASSRPALREVPRAETAFPNTGMLKILAPAALAALALFWLSNRSHAPMSIPPPGTTVSQTMPAELGTQVTSLLDTLKGTLGGIKDAASAEAAVTPLLQTTIQIEKAKTVAAGLTPEARKPLAALIAAALPGLSSTIEKVLAIPGASTILKPILDKILGNLNTLAKP